VIRVYDAAGNVIETHEHAKSRFLAVSLAEIEECVARPTPLKLLTVNHAMRTLVYLLCNEPKETAGQQGQ